MATVVFKPTEACNAKCIYCDVVHKKTRSPETMPLETLELFFSRVNEFLLERPAERMEIIWHGGEPLLLGPEYFSKALSFQQKHCAETSQRINHNVQSNLTLFSPDFTDVLKKLGIESLGTSYDQIENLRGLGAQRDSKAYNKQFMNGVRLAEQEGFSWGVIYVVTKLSLSKPLEIFNFLSNLSPKGSFNLNPVLIYDSKLDHLRITPEEYTDFLGAIFRAWWNRREEFSKIEPFSSLTSNLLEGNRSLMCCDSGACAYSHINLSPDGSLSHCGRSADWGLLNYGSIFDKSLSEVLADPQRDVLMERNTVLPETECKGCRFWDICHGGCPLDAWSASGSFLHKSQWCYAKKGFIEQYFEPIVHSGSSDEPKGSSQTSPKPRGTQTSKGISSMERDNSGEPTWINPIGGLGDTLMISGVLKQVSEKYPSRKFNLVDRTKYGPLLEGHPAIAHIGHPRPGAEFLSTNYWDHKDFGQLNRRAYQVLARIFGLETPVEERLYVPWGFLDDPVLMDRIPWKPSNVLICQSSDSPRKQMGLEKWESLVEMFKGDDIGVVQVGKIKDRYVRGAYSLLGLTTPRQLISIVRHFDAVVTADNFIMHASHLCGVPAVVLWGPTDHRVYGYSGQIHLQAEMDCEYSAGCIGPGRGNLYQTDCPEGTAHCMNKLYVETIHSSIMSLL